MVFSDGFQWGLLCFNCEVHKIKLGEIYWKHIKFAWQPMLPFNNQLLTMDFSHYKPLPVQKRPLSKSIEIGEWNQTWSILYTYLCKENGTGSQYPYWDWKMLPCESRQNIRRVSIVFGCKSFDSSWISSLPKATKSKFSSMDPASD